MKRNSIIVPISLAVIILILFGMASPMNMSDVKLKEPFVQVETVTNLEIHEGYVSLQEETVLVKQGQKTLAKVHLGEPVIVAMAEQEEIWGYFQFPVLGRATDGTLVVDWQMKADTHTTYGIRSDRTHVPMVSNDDGLTWHPWDKKYNLITDSYKSVLNDGTVMQVYTPQAEDITKYKELKEVAKVGNKTFYRIIDLPDNLRGVYIKHWDADLKKSRIIHAKLKDDEALRYSIDGKMPIVWWGNIKETVDGILYAGTYPACYKDKKGQVMPNGVSFYKSCDKGATWEVISKIPYQPDITKDPVAPYKVDGCFEEPTFEILADNTFMCVMRTGGASPMYRTYSRDAGKTWSKPEPFTPNGVKPLLMTLGNGVIVLTSGRPGVQIRLNIDGRGKSWSQPIEMMAFMEGSKYDLYASCGYASTLEADDNSFYIVYSDFKKKNKKGEYRKTIMFRKITINLQ